MIATASIGSPLCFVSFHFYFTLYLFPFSIIFGPDTRSPNPWTKVSSSISAPPWARPFSKEPRRKTAEAHLPTLPIISRAVVTGVHQLQSAALSTGQTVENHTASQGNLHSIHISHLSLIPLTIAQINPSNAEVSIPLVSFHHRHRPLRPLCVFPIDSFPHFCIWAFCRVLG